MRYFDGVYRIFARVAVAIVILIAVDRASAVEIHSFMLPNCRIENGIVVNMGESFATLIDLSGQSKSIEIKSIRAVFVSSVLDNPLSSVHQTSDVTTALRRVTVGKETFLAWPVRFVESLVIFYDTSGKTRVYDRETISKIRPVETGWTSALTASGAVKPIRGMDLRDLSSECPSIGEKGGLRPTRVMVDQIKVDQYLSDLQKGYQELEAYQERTYLYARPLLFDQKTRFSILMPGTFSERPETFIPIGVQWTTGRPFHFQGFTRVGGQAAEFSPYIQPFSGIRSDLKAHIFHLSFVGDIRGLSGGSAVFTEQVNIDKNKIGGNGEGQIGMNYMLLMGGDYGPLSLSAGFFYPTHFFRVGTGFREIKANQRSIAYRAMWTLSKMKFYGLFSNFDFKSGAATDDDYGRYYLISPLISYSLNGQLLRGGWSWDIDNLTRLSVDGLMNRALYSGRSASASESFDLNRWAAAATIRRDFGDYIGLSVTATWSFIDRNFSSLPVTSGATTPGTREQENPFTVGGQLEIIL